MPWYHRCHIVCVALLLTADVTAKRKASVAPLCWTGKQKAVDCRPQDWGATDSGIINASLLDLGLGCTSEDRAPLPEGSVALVARGVCPFAQKAAVVSAMGAVAIIFYDPKDPIDSNIMSTTGSGVDIPLVAVGRADGQRLVTSVSKRPLLVSIAFSAKWHLERAEDKWRRATLAPDATADKFLFHGSVLARLLRHGQAMRALRRAVVMAQAEVDAGRSNSSTVLADAKYDLTLLERVWRNESALLWEDFAARRALPELRATFKSAMTLASENPWDARGVMHEVAHQMQGEYGVDLHLSPSWPMKEPHDPFEMSERYGKGLANRYSCMCRGGESIAVDERGGSVQAVGQSCQLRVAVEMWRFISASYAVVGVNTLVQLSALRDSHGICLSVLNPPLYEGGWRHIDGLYPSHVEELLRRIPLASDEASCPDIVLRMYFPFDLEPFPCPETRTIVFGTSEFGISSDRALKNTMEWEDMNKSIVFMTPSKWSADGFVRSGMAESQIWVVPHGIDPEIFRPPVSKSVVEETREALGWKKNEVVFLNVGMMSHNKGLKEMLAAFNMLWKWNERQNDAKSVPLSDRRSVKLVFKGPSHIPPHLDSREIKRGGGETERQWYYQGRPLLDQDVASTDAIEVISNSSLSSKELADLMAAADVYLSAYKAEGFNLPVLESMAVGTPVIVTKGGPTDDFTTDAFAKYAAGEVVPGMFMLALLLFVRVVD